MLVAQSRRLGLKAIQYPGVGDDVDATRSAIQDALKKVDMLVLTGGVSMGKHDYVPKVLKDEGFEIIFHKVAVKPGKPVLFGRRGDQLVFGLPGNPVSSFVTFELFVRPAVCRWMGRKELFLTEAQARLEAPMKHRSGRDLFAPGRTRFSPNGILVEPIKTKGSADLVAFSQANSLIVLPAECKELETGRSVTILLLDERNVDGRKRERK
jgi:molybdopterin molybdotransferase